MTTTTTATAPRPVLADAASRTARLDQVRAALKARGCSARVVVLAAGERAETVIEGYGTEGI